MKKNLNLFIFSILLLLLSACGGSQFSKMEFNDGEYIGKSEGGTHPSYTTVKIEIKNNKIVKTEAEFLDAEKNIKDENYGKDKGDKKYQIAQKAVAGMYQYADILLEVQDPELVDAISGATVSAKSFKEAVWNALENAKK